MPKSRERDSEEEDGEVREKDEAKEPGDSEVRIEAEENEQQCPYWAPAHPCARILPEMPSC